MKLLIWNLNILHKETGTHPNLCKPVLTRQYGKETLVHSVNANPHKQNVQPW